MVQIILPASSNQPYQRVDFFQVSSIGPDFVVSMFQLDYQDVVAKQAAATEGQIVTTTGIPIARVMMDKEGFERLRSELNTVHDKVMAK